MLYLLNHRGICGHLNLRKAQKYENFSLNNLRNLLVNDIFL